MNKKDIRKNFRNLVISRDKSKCKICGKSDVKLDAHHIVDRNQMPNGGHVVENGITLCDDVDGCHLKAERFHITGGKEFIKGFHPSDLFKIINSSYQIAYQKSMNLK